MNQCTECGAPKAPGRSRCWPCYYQYRSEEESRPVQKMLYIDIETTPMVNYNWGIWQQNVGLSQIIEPQRVMCFAAKWEGEKPTLFYSEWGPGGHEYMVKKAHELLSQADVVTHFYGSRFDIPHLNTEFLKYGLAPPSPFKQVDLKLAVSKTFKFPSNKLQYVSQFLGMEGKDKMEFEDWIGCMKGDKKAQKKMEKYNRLDTEILQTVYAELLPWIPGLPNRNLWDGGGCPRCGSDEIREHGLYRTPLSAYKQYQCESCNGWLRSSKRVEGVGLQLAVL